MISLWKVKIHKLVLSEDFKSIDINDRRMILSDIRKKLAIAPDSVVYFKKNLKKS